MKFRLIVLITTVAIILTAGAARATEPSGALVRFVIVTRHGVRSPIPGNSELSKWSLDAWPAWPVGVGELTLRGKQLIQLIGGYYRELLINEKLLPSSGCPRRGSVFVWADTDQRTVETGRGLIDGLAPGCAITPKWSDRKIDPIFRSISAGACPIDQTLAEAAILGRTGNDLNAVAQADHASIETLQSIMHCCNGALCDGSSKCGLPDLGSRLEPVQDGTIRMEGGLAIASVASEIFLLEFAQGFTGDKLGWGRADQARILEATRLHTRYFDLMFRTRYLADHGGSLLMRRVLAALKPSRAGGEKAPDFAPSDAKFIAYVGHDTNVANLAAMLDASWQLPGYQANYTVPGGALVFELRRAGDGALKVYSSYLAQTMTQLRAREPLSLKNPPARAALFIPACSSAESGYPCGLEDFERVGENWLVPTCTSESKIKHR
jgi:4-phytase/acid phosphatase